MNLNVGCGINLKSDCINLDSHDKNGAQVVFNLWDIINKDIKLPFNDNTFDTVYCEEVLEDFIYPRKIMDELVRVSNNLITIKVPRETNMHINNIEHVYPFTVGKLISYAEDNPHYGIKSPIKFICYEYYAISKRDYYARFCCFVINIIGYKITECTPIKYIFPAGLIKVTYKKLRD